MSAIFSVGDVVRLVGLVSSPLLNGAIETVVGDTDNKSRGRYAVQLKSPAAAVAAHPISLSPSNLMKVMEMECSTPGCYQTGTQGCSACLREIYCSAECQKTDWKSHKAICRLFKMMPDTLLPFSHVKSISSRFKMC
jgi:hypothetical protein